MGIAGTLVVILAAVTVHGDHDRVQSFESYKQKARVVKFECKSEEDKDTFVKIEVCTPDIIRVRMTTRPTRC